MKVGCPKCGLVLEAPDAMAGRAVQCSRCSEVFTLAPPAPAAPMAAAGPYNPYAPPTMDGSPAAGPTASDLDQVIEHRKQRMMMRGAGTGSLIFGVIAIGMGVAMLGENPLNIVLIALGLYLCGEGIWLLAAPGAAGLVAHGIGMLMIGSWNLLITVLEAAAGGRVTKVAVLGVFQLFWGFQSFWQARKYAISPKPSDETLKALDALVKSITKAKMANDPTLIEFAANGNWKARLSGRQAVFVHQNAQDIVFADQSQVEFVDNGKVLMGSSRKVQFNFGAKKLKGTCSPDAMARYQAWKQGPGPQPLPLDAEVV